MKKKRWCNLIIFSMLLMLAVSYCTSIFTDGHFAKTELVKHDIEGSSAEGAEEGLAENFCHLFLQEKTLYHLKPFDLVLFNLNVHRKCSLPETYLKHHTPPPDFA